MDPRKDPLKLQMRDLRYYSCLKERGLLKGTIREAFDKRSRRDILLKANDPEKSLHLDRHLISVDVAGVKLATQYADFKDLPDHKRKRNWGGIYPTSDVKNRAGRLRTESINHARFKDWNRYYAQFRSFCVLSSDDKKMLWFIGNEHGTMKAAHGWVFGVDHLGPFVVLERRLHQIEYRYHFVAPDVNENRVFNAARDHVATQLRLKRERREQKRKEKEIQYFLKEADLLGVFVTFSDARAAGNCAAGTAEWCRQNKLPLVGGVPVKLFQGMTDFRVVRTIEQARRRSALDLKRGYCDTIYYNDLDRRTAADNSRLWMEPVSEELAAC
jgi:hypothetical protein